MIKSVHIKNFKIHKDNEYNFKPLTVLTGVNSSGKSSIISALRLNNAKSQNHSDTISLREINHIDFESVINPTNADHFEIKICEDSGVLTHYRYSRKDENIAGKLKAVKIGDYAENILEENEFIFVSQFRSPNIDSSKFLNMVDNDFHMDSLGVNTAEIIANFKPSNINEKIRSNYNRQFNSALEEIFKEIGITIGISAVTTPDTAYIEIIQNGIRNRLSNVGYGIAYLLPILTAALITKPGGTLIIDSPEAHLHPSAQSSLGRFLTKIAATGVQVIIETHSDHIINGIQYAVLRREGELALSKDDVIFHFLSAENEFSHSEIIIDDNGKLTPAPRGFFDQIQKDLVEILKLRTKK